MVRVTIHSNRLGTVSRAVRDEVEKGVDDAAEAIMSDLRSAVWKRKRYVERSVKDHSTDAMRAEIWIGVRGAIGFYSGFQEFGTVKQAPRPVVGPIAAENAGSFEGHVRDAIRRAANAG